jgi:hypothetical protein
MVPATNYTQPQPPTQHPSWPRPFLITKHNLLCHPTCPWATSITALDPDSAERLLLACSCKRWGCPVCARVKVRVLAAKTLLAGPNRLLTLTIDPKRYATPRDAFEQTAHLVPELIRSLRGRFGTVEYLRVTEVTKAGWPHYHLLLRSKYIPQPVVKATWHALTHALIVDLRQVNKTFSAYTYLVKYLTKLHKLEWTERHVSYSRQFFPAEASKKPNKGNLTDIERIPEHPYMYLYKWYNGQKVTQRSPTAWVLDVPQSSSVSSALPNELGVANTKAPSNAE